MKILVTNIYSYENKGDAAIVIAMVSEIRRVFPEAHIYLQTVDVEHDKGKYDEPVESSLLWILLSSLRDEPILKRVYELTIRMTGLILYLLFYRLLRVRLNWLLRGQLKQFVAYTEQTDLVIACGGGYLRTVETKPQVLLWLFVVCLNSLSGHYLGKPVYMYSQSIGPLNDWLARRLVKFTLNRVQLIEVREDISMQYVEKLKIHTPAIRTADPVFLLKGQGRRAPVKLEPAPIQVGVTVRNWFSTELQLMQYLKIVARLIDYLITNYKARVTYTPQVIATGFGDDDRLVAKKLRSLVKNKKSFTLLLDDLHPLELIGLCSKMDLFIGTRMHSNIFSLINDVPVVAIQYEHKTQGIMDRLGIGDATIDIEKINFEELKQKVE
jgi:colanic acid/amylovoran biosynthesis protein